MLDIRGRFELNKEYSCYKCKTKYKFFIDLYENEGNYIVCWDSFSNQERKININTQIGINLIDYLYSWLSNCINCNNFVLEMSVESEYYKWKNK